MTAEVAIMNKMAIALATDTAVTVGNGRKVYHTAEKLFGLSAQPVGIMHYGNAELMDVPWETVIKMYRDKLDGQRFATLAEYADHFVQFLETHPLFGEKRQNDWVRDDTRSYLRSLRHNAEEKPEVDPDGEDGEAASSPPESPADRLKRLVSEGMQHFEEKGPLARLPEDYGARILARFGELFGEVVREVFDGFPLDDATRDSIVRLVVLSYDRDVFPCQAPGIVFAGFGDDDAFPSLIALRIEAVIADRLKYSVSGSCAVDFENDAHVFPFAQADTMVGFIEGVLPEYQGKIDECVNGLIEAHRDEILKVMNEKDRARYAERFKGVGDEMCGSLSEYLAQFRQERFVQPVLSAVSALPKQDLATVAESLVSITSFRHRVSLELETVGGSIDVALISKGDGFLWVKKNDPARPGANPRAVARAA